MLHIESKLFDSGLSDVAATDHFLRLPPTMKKNFPRVIESHKAQGNCRVEKTTWIGGKVLGINYLRLMELTGPTSQGYGNDIPERLLQRPPKTALSHPTLTMVDDNSSC